MTIKKSIKSESIVEFLSKKDLLFTSEILLVFAIDDK